MLIASAFFEVDAKVPTRTAAVAFLINLIAFNMFKLIFIYTRIYIVVHTYDMCVLCVSFLSLVLFIYIFRPHRVRTRKRYMRLKKKSNAKRSHHTRSAAAY